MKKILKVLFTIIFTIISFGVIYRLIYDYSNDGLLFLILAITFFIIFLFSWVAPKIFFNLCWKITKILPDNFDYDTSYSKVELISVGLIIVSNILLIIGLLILFL